MVIYIHRRYPEIEPKCPNAHAQVQLISNKVINSADFFSVIEDLAYITLIRGWLNTDKGYRLTNPQNKAALKLRMVDLVADHVEKSWEILDWN